ERLESSEDGADVGVIAEEDEDEAEPVVGVVEVTEDKDNELVSDQIIGNEDVDNAESLKTRMKKSESFNIFEQSRDPFEDDEFFS
ncbi:unnamed protein product, partial [Allacma fusca]